MVSKFWKIGITAYLENLIFAIFLVFYIKTFNFSNKLITIHLISLLAIILTQYYVNSKFISLLDKLIDDEKK